MVSEKSGIQAEALLGVENIDHAFFTREGGVSGGIYASRNIGQGSDDDKSAVKENRARCARDLGVGIANLATPYQIHSSNVVTVEDVWEDGNRPKADALVTDRPGVLIGIATADCGPVLFADDKARVVGAAHAGWRGATGGVLENTIGAMEALGAERGAIRAVLGPTIGQQSYEVGPEFVDRLKGLTEENAQYLKPSDRDGHAMFDLPGYITDRLMQCGLKTVENLALCTYQDETRFYSYRRATHRSEADYGRLLSAIVLK
ncbi:MAG: peptidoglycan editing factor PgeF [Pseudomonadota bacterium]